MQNRGAFGLVTQEGYEKGNLALSGPCLSPYYLPHLPLAPCSQAGGMQGASNTPCSCRQVWDLPRVNFLSLPSEECGP